MLNAHGSGPHNTYCAIRKFISDAIRYIPDLTDKVLIMFWNIDGFIYRSVFSLSNLNI